MAYKGDEWLGGPLLRVEYEGIMRGIPMSTMHFNPVRYNPVKNQIKVYFDVACSIETAVQTNRKQIPSKAFERLFGRVVRQNLVATKKGIFAEEPMTLVILSDTLFRETLQPFIQWKTKKGFKVEEAYLHDPAVGSSRKSIKSYLEILYHQPAEGVAPPTYLLIVGDVENFPLSQSGGQITDLYYATFDGEDDYIPDLFYGRISVTSENQLQNVLDKILEYEQYQFPDPSFLNESVLIAGVDGTFAGTHGNGQINYAHDYYFNEANGITAHTFLYPESDTSDGRILELISGGVGFVNYTGHGVYDKWINPTFHQNDIEDLENQGKYPVMIGNGCETNVFNLGECFAEALLRAPGKGALAYIGCTNDSYWDEDYFWSVGVGPIVAEPLYEETTPGFYDKVFHSHNESHELWTPSLGEMIFGGNMSVQQSNSSRKKFYWEIYQLAGDPTIVPWFSLPVSREVLHPDLLPSGSNRMDVTCAPYDYVALSKNGVLLDALHASREGYATLFLPDTVKHGIVDLVVTGDRYIPFTDEVVVGVPPDPYLDLAGYDLSHESVEEDGMINLNEQFSLDMQWINRGAADLHYDTLVLFSGHEHVELLDSLVVLENVGAGDTIAIEDVFRIRAGIQVKDQETVLLGVYRKGDQESRKIFMKEKIVAPVLLSGGILWDDRPSGNGNGIAEHGEWLVCDWAIRNVGHFRTGKLTGRALQEEKSIFEQIEFGSLPQLEPGDSSILTFSVLVSGPAKGPQQSGLFLAGDQHATLLDSFSFYTGGHYEDFSKARLDNYPFINTSASPWLLDNQTYTSSHYSLRSGNIPNNGLSEFSVSFATTEADTLSFAYRVSSETGYDYLHFYVDSILIKSWSGEKGWNHHSFAMEPGLHEITWTYRKDKSLSRGEDAAWIDDIVFPGTAFRMHDLSLVKVLQPDSGPWLSNQEQVRYLVKNTGMEPIPGFTVSVTVDEGPAIIDSISTSILPGEEVEFAISETFDLSAMGFHRLNAWMVAVADRYGGNNYLELEIDRTSYPDLALSMVQLEELEGIRSDAIIAIENDGNIGIDSFRFELWFDGTISESGARFIGLETGQKIHENFTLVDSVGGKYTTGNYNYLIRSVTADSVLSNNEISGVLYWHAMGTNSSDRTHGLLVYPNPTREGFTLLLPAPAVQEITVELVNMDGKVEATYVVEKDSDHLYVPVSTRAPGNYLLRIGSLEVSMPVLITD